MGRKVVIPPSDMTRTLRSVSFVRPAGLEARPRRTMHTPQRRRLRRERVQRNAEFDAAEEIAERSRDALTCPRHVTIPRSEHRDGTPCPTAIFGLLRCGMLLRSRIVRVRSFACEHHVPPR